MTVRIGSPQDIHVDPGCGYCGDPDKTPTNLVVGHPAPDVVTVVDSEGCRCCGDCTQPAIWLAMQEGCPVMVIPIKAVEQ